jgi:hypothetical protein
MTTAEEQQVGGRVRLSLTFAEQQWQNAPPLELARVLGAVEALGYLAPWATETGHPLVEIIARVESPDPPVPIFARRLFEDLTWAVRRTWPDMRLRIGLRDPFRELPGYAFPWDAITCPAPRSEVARLSLRRCRRRLELRVVPPQDQRRCHSPVRRSAVSQP